MKIRCLIVDDKPLAIDLLTDYVSKVPFLELIAVTTNPIEALSLLKQHSVDLIFLDIQMPELTGLQFIKLAGPSYKIILTTAYTDYAMEGYEHDVIDYLLKPISFERFYRAANKALSILGTDHSSRNDLKTELIFATDYLFVKTATRLQKVNLADILYIQSLQNYIIIVCLNEKIMSLQPLKKFEEQLPAQEFVRVHKSYLIAIRQISSLEGNRIYIGDVTIPIGDTFKESFLQKINWK
jgi:two-component system LytT family response regulator